MATTFRRSCSIKPATIFEFLDRGSLSYEAQEDYLDYLSRDRQMRVLETGEGGKRKAEVVAGVYIKITKDPTAKYGIQKRSEHEDLSRYRGIGRV